MAEQVCMAWGTVKAHRSPRATPPKPQPKKCAAEGCGADLRANNSTGACWRHWYTTQTAKEIRQKCKLKWLSKVAGDPEWRQRVQAARKARYAKICFSTPTAKIGYAIKVAKRRAIRRGLPFSLTVADLGPLPTCCPVLGIGLVYDNRAIKADSSASLDRIIPELGYVRGNVRIISWKANRLRNNGTAEELAAVAADAAELLRRHGLKAVNA